LWSFARLDRTGFPSSRVSKQTEAGKIRLDEDALS
jgi:hypothetical protein